MIAPTAMMMLKRTNTPVIAFLRCSSANLIIVMWPHDDATTVPCESPSEIAGHVSGVRSFGVRRVSSVCDSVTVRPPVDANSGNGTFDLSPDLPAIGAGTNSRLRAPSNPGELNWQKDLPLGPNGGNNAREWWAVSTREPRCTGG